MSKIKVIVNGGAGKMGQETVSAIAKEIDLELVGACDINHIGIPISNFVRNIKNDMKIAGDLAEKIKQTNADVVVDFTLPSHALKNAQTILSSGAHAVIGTTGLTAANLEAIRKACIKYKRNCLVAPNFAIGAILMMKFAKEAARYMPEVEIIEMHHDQKIDAPSGTALKTAELISADRHQVKTERKEIENLKGARGGELNGIRIHSVRLKGFVASQEVILGGLGQTLKIRHDSINRESFMPGVIMALRQIKKLKGLVYGLENLLG